MASFNQFFPKETEQAPQSGDRLTPGQLVLDGDQIYAFVGVLREAVANDVTTNPSDWMLLSGVSDSNEDTNTRRTNGSFNFWSGTGAAYDALATTATPAGPGYDTSTIYYITDR